MNSLFTVSPQYRKPVFASVVLQVLAVLLSVMCLDMGVMIRICGLAMWAFWAGTLLVILRRPQTPTRTDVAWIRFGFIPVFIITFLIGQLVLHWRGVIV